MLHQIIEAIIRLCEAVKELIPHLELLGLEVCLFIVFVRKLVKFVKH
jgi:hypothetical protein